MKPHPGSVLGALGAALALLLAPARAELSPAAYGLEYAVHIRPYAPERAAGLFSQRKAI
jgi:hypothetical protein